MSETVEQRIDYLDNILDEYESKLGLAKYSENYNNAEEIQIYLNYSRDQLEKLSPQDMGQISYRITSYSLFIQRTINREIARAKWAESLIKEILSDKLGNYSGYSYAEKFGKALKDNEVATKLNSIQRHAQQRIDRISYVASGLNNLSNVLINLMKVRKE